MAEIQEQASSGGKNKPKKQSTKVDLTPMVDLAFLLITFFMFTTTLAKPKAMDIAIPADKKDDEDQKEFPASKAMTILLTKDNQVIYYFGKPEDAAADPSAVIATNFDSKAGIRKAILDKRALINEQHKVDSAGHTKMLVLIKADDGCKYKNMVDILDEMHICGIKLYALIDISEPEKQMVASAMASATRIN
jgi:biopolymer transport protein ExbD